MPLSFFETTIKGSANKVFVRLPNLWNIHMGENELHILITKQAKPICKILEYP